MEKMEKNEIDDKNEEQIEDELKKAHALYGTTEFKIFRMDTDDYYPYNETVGNYVLEKMNRVVAFSNELQEERDKRLIEAFIRKGNEVPNSVKDKK